MSADQLVVLGMHRSGTSGVTRLLNLAGAYFGDEAAATAPNEENPRGFWERRDLRAVCDGLLEAGGFDWWNLAGFSPDAIPAEARRRWLDAFTEVRKELDQHRPWVIKEPRLCVLFPLVRPLLDAPVCIHVTREPLEVAQSVQRRNDLPIGTALALWELYNVRAFSASLGLPRVLVRYDDLIVDPVATLDRLRFDLAQVGVDELQRVSAEDIHDFITPDLHRHRSEATDRRGRLNQQQAELAAAIDDGSVLDRTEFGPISAAATDELERIRLSRSQTDALAQQQRHVVELDRERERLRADVAAARRETVATEEQRETEVAAAERETEAIERYRETELARRRELGRQADLALTSAAAQLERFDGSNLGRATRLLHSARQLVTPGSHRTDAGPIDHVVRDLTERRGDLALLSEQDPAPGGGVGGSYPSGHHLVRRTRPKQARSDRPSVAVISWDVGHNPLGRANVLAEVLARRFDVELWGAQFERYGSQVWAPLRNGEIPVNVFPGDRFPAYLRTLEDVVGAIDADAIWVSKPRLPSYLLAILAKQARNRPLVLDVDDHELAFFDENTPLELAEVLGRQRVADLEWPFERDWTRLCDGYIDLADQVTVSNEALQERYGGLIVPHARDERLFDPERYDRDACRRELGVGPDDRLLLFGGTPRAHKGVVEVLEALDRIGDDRYRVALFGTREFDELRGRIGDLARWAKVLPALDFARLPAVVAAADLACVLQDPAHPVSRYQMPAKVSDALAMGVPCLVTPTPPLAPMIAADVLLTVAPGEELHERIVRVFDEADATAACARRGRELFLRDLSHDAVAQKITPVFERLIADPPPMAPRLGELAAAPAQVFAPSDAPGPPEAPRPPDAPEPTPVPARVPRRLRVGAEGRETGPGQPSAEQPPAGPFDVVMFWKQNDSGLYGRRQDMFLAELARSERVATIVHFDNPISPETLATAYRAAWGQASDQRRWVATESVARALGRRNEPGVHRHTFLYGARWTRRFGRPPRGAYRSYVQQALASHGIGNRPVIVWGYPSNPDLPDLIDALDPDLVVSDVVDDNRTWYLPGEERYGRIEDNYRAVLARSDVTLANCEPVAAAMTELGADVTVVPNGVEMPTGAHPGPRPAVLRGLTGPVIAYVGNLSARLDLELIEELAARRPDWNLVFVGSAHLDRSILALDRFANVSFLGTMRYEDVRRFLAHVDVALIPHVDNEMTRSMNPLKAFVYAAAGVPTVATPVANLADFEGLITVAEDAAGFEQAIAAHLAAGRPLVDPEMLRPHSWEQRLATVWGLIDGAMAEPVATSNPAASTGTEADSAVRSAG